MEQTGSWTTQYSKSNTFWILLGQTSVARNSKELFCFFQAARWASSPNTGWHTSTPILSPKLLQGSLAPPPSPATLQSHACCTNPTTARPPSTIHYLPTELSLYLWGKFQVFLYHSFTPIISAKTRLRGLSAQWRKQVSCFKFLSKGRSQSCLSQFATAINHSALDLYNLFLSALPHKTGRS